jgi:AraC family transcriptional regulator
VGLGGTTTLEKPIAPFLWKELMMRRNELTNRTDNNYYSVQIFNPAIDFNSFTPQPPFTTLASVEIAQNSSIPEGMQKLILRGGLYLIVLYKRHHAHYNSFAQKLFTEVTPFVHVK